ncbi:MULTISPECIES: CdaR family transcriptional regulator [Bacillaceae]|uniref:Carbohydrate diacid regulator n=1 Tax=Peribacillus huizhouensis TaxID=1501239 RepID=A0ABR6CNL8_9BACI|nr:MULTISPECIES: sugar diacid recognition domain-containing protein [Bacillaceae]MBA9026599.1 carbohydrate diacid regulator [Peribacillus huizhouensis]
MLTRSIAQTIVKETSIRLNRNINIMNDSGIIIASRDVERIDDIHEGALQVLKSGQTLIIPTNQSVTWKGSHPGINLPIVFHDKIVGVIGITGNPDDMADLGELVKMTTELMIKAEYMASQMEWKKRTKEMVIEELLKLNPSFDHIRRGLNLLGNTFHPPYNTVVIQMAEGTITNHIVVEKIEEILGEKNGIVGFINTNRILLAFSNQEQTQVDKKLKKIYHTLKKLQLTFRLAFSIPFDSLNMFNQSYQDCDLALAISHPSKDMIAFADVELKVLIHHLNRYDSERFYQRVMTKTLIKYTDTLESFFKNNFNIQQTADELFIHRNTLIYRLKKIEEETGYNPKHFKDAITLQLAIWISNKQSG